MSIKHDNMPVLTSGKTTMYRSIELSGRYGASVYLKDESKNPFGTFKDRRCAALLERSADRQELVFVQITAGNSGYSLGMLAREEERRTGRSIKVVNIVPKEVPRAIKDKLRTCSLVYEMDLTRKIISHDEMIEIARQLTSYSGPEQNILMVEDFGFVNGYRKIVDEIAESGVIPNYIFCPVGEGELATELAFRASEVWPGQPPKIIGVTVSSNAILGKEDFIQRLARSIADKLVNSYSKFKGFVRRFVEEGKIELLTVSEGEIEREYGYLNRIGLSCEPSAAAAFAGAIKYGIKQDDIVVIVNTGKGVYDQDAVDRVWTRKTKRFLKNVGMVLGGAVLAVSLIASAIMFKNYEHKIWRHNLEQEVLLYFNEDRDGWLKEDEALKVCTVVPNKKCEAGIHPLVYGVSSFSDKELAFVASYERLNKHSGVAERETQRTILEEWRVGAFDEFLHGNAPWILRADRAIRLALTPSETPICGPDATFRLKFGLSDKGCPSK